MPKNADSLNRSLFELLQSKGYDPTLLSTAGKEIPTPEEAEVFQFNFVKDGEDYGKVTMSIDGLHKLIIYYDDDIANSEKETDESGDLSWYQLLNQLKRFAQKYQLSFELRNVSNLKHDMAKREYMKKKESISEGYYAMGKKASYNDAVPSVKIVLQHTRQIEEGEQRYRNIAKIFLENENGERFLAPTIKPGIARVYARHLAEGGVPNDDRWNHIKGLCEEYQKMAGFVRATRSGQFNESTQKLIAEGINHYQSLRESLGKLAGHRGYNAYFESWTPTLMEDDTDTTSLNELFVQETVDPRIESVMPILARLHKNLSEMSEVNELAEWADKLLEGDEDIEDNEAEDAIDNAEQDLTEAPGAETLAHNQSTEAGNLKKLGLAEEDVEEGVIDTLKKAGKKVIDYIAPSDEELLRDLQKKAGIPPHAQHGKKRMAVPNDELKETPDTQFHEEDMAEALDPMKKQRLQDLIDQYTDATDPEYMGDDDSEDIIAQIRAEFGDRTADSVADGPSMHFPRPGHVMGYDDLEFKQMRKKLSPNRITKIGKLHKQDSDAMKRDIKSRLDISEEEVEESGLQAYLGNKKYGKEGMDALRKAGRDGASKEKMAQIRAKYDKLDEEELAEGILDKIKGAIGLGPQKGSERWVRMEIPAIEKPNQVKDKLIGLGLKSVEHDTSSSGPTNTFYAKTDISDNAHIRNEIKKLYSSVNPKNIFVGNSNGPSNQTTAQPAATAPAANTAPADQPATGPDLRVDRGRLPSGGQGTSSRPSSTGGRLSMPGDPKGVYAGDDRSSFRGDGSFRYESAEQDVEEGLDANQKRVGQLGPTEKVGPKGAVGKLVGAGESVELSEKEKKHMKEGQEELDFIKGLIPKNTLKEDANQVKFLGFNSATYPLQDAIADKAYRMGNLRSMKMDANGKPYAIIHDPDSAGEYKAYWNDAAGAWAIDFD